MASTTVQHTGITNDRVRRKLGFNAEVTISTDGIVRNEFREYTQVYQDGAFTKFKPIFDAPYGVVADLLNGMENNARNQYMSNSWFEIAIDERDLHSTTSDLTILDELARLAPLLSRIQNLSIKVKIPATGWMVMTNEEDKVSSTRLKSMEAVLALPRGFSSNRNLLIPYILPFYALDTFTAWKLRLHVHGCRIQLADTTFIKAIDEKHAEIRREAKEEKDLKDAEQKEIVVTMGDTYHLGRAYASMMEEIDGAIVIHRSNNLIPIMASSPHKRNPRKNTSPGESSAKTVPGKSVPGKELCKYPHCKNAKCQSALCKSATRDQ
ncbi:uncharacterized protein PAC_07232 [Phialocephala subalpina]|uniref:Uncharacterized protein n=1 Tax=Phialocephala subalpina TaxID=576137 RepID=A0A1L7WX67_9HELO|nr:uncharacterized protein PAC_07232 [Phialocephala subalpina]